MRVVALALLAVAGCVARSRPAEMVVLPPQPAPGPWLVLRDALNGCARDHGLLGELSVRIEIDDDGAAGSVASAYSDEFAACIGRSLARTRYRTHRDRVIEIVFRVAG